MPAAVPRNRLDAITARKFFFMILTGWFAAKLIPYKNIKE